MNGGRPRTNGNSPGREIKKQDATPITAATLAKIQLLVPVQAAAIGCHHHVCRGDTAGRDDLFRRILKSLSGFYVEIRIRLEGGKITPLTRARVAVKRMLRRFGRK